MPDSRPHPALAVVVTGPLTVSDLAKKLAARQNAAEAEINELHEQIGKLTDALATAERGT